MAAVFEIKGLDFGKTLVSAGETVPVRILNTSDNTQSIGAQSVVAVAKPVTGVTELEIPEANSQSINSPQQVVENCVDNLPETRKGLWKRSTEQLTEDEGMAVADPLHQYNDVFSLSEHDLGSTNLIGHQIDTGNARPIKQKPRRTSPSKHAEIERQVVDLLQRGVVKKSNSSWSSPVVLVTKKDGCQRFCVDYRLVNAATVKDVFPLPRIDDSLSALSGAKWFSTLDLASGYWQVPMDPASSDKAAFVTTSGLYEWTVMPFGLTSSLSTFERLMELILAGLRFETCLIYLDDIIIHGKTFEEELKRLEEVFVRFRSSGLKLKPSKCVLFQKRVVYLGHIVSESGITTDPGKIERICEWPVPENVTEINSFLGLASYYRRFVPNFAQVARPLHKLTEANVQFVWTPECQFSFQTLKTLLSTAPVWLQVKEPEEQLTRWIEFMSSFSYEIEYRAGQRHQNADALSQRPCNDGCKWCKEWKGVEQMVSVAVQTDVSSVVCGEFVIEQREALSDKQTETEFSVCTEHSPSDPAVADSRCITIKLEPTWTREYLYSEQVADPSLKVIIQFKEADIYEKQQNGRREIMTSECPVSHSGLGTAFGCTTFVEKRGGTPNWIVLGKALT